MSLLGTLSIASSALGVDQSALQTTSNNIANAGNADYTRERATLTPGNSVQVTPGVFLGTGVDLTAVSRQVDASLDGRLRNAASDNAAAQTTNQWVGQVQTTLNALSGQDLSTQLTTFFTGFSNLANNPTDAGQRQVVLQDGANLAGYVQGVSTQLGTLQANVDGELPQQAATANGLADQIAKLNVEIVTQQGGTGGTANGLQDERDADLKQLSQLVNVTVQQQANGSDNVYVGSQPLVQGQTNRGLAVANVAGAAGSTQPTLVFPDTNGTVPVTSGRIGSLQSVRDQIKQVQAQVDDITHKLIGAVNTLHASGQGTTGFKSVTAGTAVLDATKPLNAAAAGLAYAPTNGSFVVHVTGTDGTATSTLVPVTLKGKPTDTSLTSLAASLNGVAGVKATVANGKLTVAAATSGATVSFSQDSSGTLAALGVNTFFTGSTAADIAVNPALTADPTLLAAGKNGTAGDNGTALAIAALETTVPAGSGADGQTLQASYQDLVNGVANTVSAAKAQSDATQAVQDTLTGQQQATGGVSLDEEMVNLLQQQQAFQASSRVVATVATMVQSLLSLV